MGAAGGANATAVSAAQAVTVTRFIVHLCEEKAAI
jgi:hypothetical protein